MRDSDRFLDWIGDWGFAAILEASFVYWIAPTVGYYWREWNNS